MEAFCWLAVSGKVSTAENLRRRGLFLENISDLYVLCGKERETNDHISVHCEFAYFLWCSFFGADWCL